MNVSDLGRAENKIRKHFYDVCGEAHTIQYLKDHDLFLKNMIGMEHYLEDTVWYRC